MCFPKTTKFLSLSCSSVLVLLIGNASRCSWQTSSVIYIYQFIFSQVNCFSFWLPENSPVARKSFNKTLKRICHLDDSFGCSPGNRMICKVHSHGQHGSAQADMHHKPQAGFSLLLAGNQSYWWVLSPQYSTEVSLLPTGCCLCENKLCFTCFTYSSLPEFQVWIPCVTEYSELGCRVQEFITMGSITETPAEIPHLTRGSPWLLPYSAQMGWHSHVWGKAEVET